MESHKQEKCAHKGCSCMAGANSKYCSPYCEAAKNTTEIACGCEHSQCAGKAS
jgi:hypothetical protein